MFGFHEAVTIVVYGRDFAFEEGTVVLGKESKVRLDVAGGIAFVYQSEYRLAYIVMSPGFFERLPQKKSMAEMMRQYLLFSYPLYASSVKAGERRDVCGSDTETGENIALIEKYNLSHQVIVVSSWYHIPRLRLLWKLHLKGKQGWDITFVSCDFRRNWKVCVREAIAIVGTLVGIRTSPIKGW